MHSPKTYGISLGVYLDESLIGLVAQLRRLSHFLQP